MRDYCDPRIPNPQRMTTAPLRPEPDAPLRPAEPVPPSVPPVSSPEPDPAVPARAALRTEKRALSRIGLSCFLMLAVATAVQFLVTFVVDLAAPWIAETPWYLYALSAVSLYLCGLPLFLLLLKKLPRYKPESRRMGAGNFFVCFSMCMGILVAGNLLGQLCNWGLGLLIQHGPVNPLDTMTDSSNLLLTCLYSVVLAPVMEEVIFRKCLCDRLLRWGQGTAVLISGLFFGLFHGNLYQFFYAFGLGLMLGYVYVRTGRLRYTVLLHMLINLLGTLSGPLLNWLLEFSGIGAGTPALQNLVSALLGMSGILLFAAAYLALCITGIVLLIARRRRFTLSAGFCTLPKGRRFSTVILNPGVLLFCLLSLAGFALNLFLG